MLNKDLNHCQIDRETRGQHCHMATGLAVAMNFASAKRKSTFSPRGGSACSRADERAVHVVGQRAYAGRRRTSVRADERNGALNAAAEEGAIERKTRARRPHAGNLGALEGQKSTAPSRCSRPCRCGRAPHAARERPARVQLAYELVWRGASRTEVVARARGRAATAISAQPSRGGGMGRIHIRNCSQFLFDPNCVKISPNFDESHDPAQIAKTGCETL